MAWNVHLHICFPCDSNDPVARIAKKGLEQLSDNKRYERFFLEDLSKRTGDNWGSKGGLSLWGIICNGLYAKDFVENLKFFWHELLAGEEDGLPLDFEHIIVFYEEEQSNAANAYEIQLDSDDSAELIIKHHKNLPFSWAQH